MVSGGEMAGADDNIGSDGIGFISITHNRANRGNVIKKLECYGEQIQNLRKKKPKKVAPQKSKNRNRQEENLLKNIRSLVSLYPWLPQEYAHLIPDGARRL